MSTARSQDPATEEEFIKALYAGGELLGSGKIVEAKDHLERAHQLSPRNEKANNLLGLTYFKLGLFDRAAEVYELLVRDNPVDPTLRVNLGLVYLKTNNLEQCIHEFEAATDLEPGHTKAHNYLGLALAQAGEYVRAKEHFVAAGSDAMADKMGRAIAAAVQGGGPVPAATVQLGGAASLPSVSAEEESLVEAPPADEGAPRAPDRTMLFASPYGGVDPEAAAAPEQAELLEDAAELAPPDDGPAVLTDDELIEATVNEEVRPISEFMVAGPVSASEVMDPPPDEAPLVDAVAAPEHTLAPVVYDEFPSSEQPAQVTDEQIEVMSDEAGPLLEAAEAEVEITQPGDAVRVATPVREPPAGWGAQFGVEPTLTDEVPMPASAEDDMRFAEDEGPSASSMEAAAESGVEAVADAAAQANTLDEMPMIEASVAGPSLENPVPADETSFAEAGDGVSAMDSQAPADETSFAEAGGDSEAMEDAPPPAAAPEPTWVSEAAPPAEDVPADPAWMTQPLSKVNLRSGNPPEAEPAQPVAETLPPEGTYAPMQAQRLVELGSTSGWSTAPTDSPFNVGKDGLAVAVAGETLVRLVNLVAVVGGLDVTPEFKRSRGRPTQEPFGSATSQLHRVKGHGTLYLEPGKAHFQAVDLDEEGAYLREERVFAFEEPIAFENGRLAAEGLTLDMVHLKGLGRVLVQLDGPLKAMPIPAGAPMVVPLSRLVGWFGFVTPRLKGFGGQGAVELTGEGYALLATGA